MCVLAQDVYSDDKVDNEAIRACLNELAAWRRRAMEELKSRVAQMRLDSSEDADEHDVMVADEQGGMAALGTDGAVPLADTGLAGTQMDATGLGFPALSPEDDVSEGERWD